MHCIAFYELSKEMPIYFNGALAQLVEQRTFNPFVVGSIPARPTKFGSTKKAASDCGFFYGQSIIQSFNAVYPELIF